MILMPEFTGAPVNTACLQTQTVWGKFGEQVIFKAQNTFRPLVPFGTGNIMMLVQIRILA